MHHIFISHAFFSHGSLHITRDKTVYKLEIKLNLGRKGSCQ